MREVKRRRLCEIDGVVDKMGPKEVEVEIEIRFGDAELVDCVWELVSNASDACTSKHSDSISKG